MPLFLHSLFSTAFGLLASIAVTTIIFMPSQSWAEQRLALVIGNSSYSAAGNLPNARNDATLIEATFKAVGFETTLLLDLSGKQMGEALDALAERVGKLDVVALYFAGHGIQKDGRNFLVPVDAELKSETAIERETIALDAFIRVLERVPMSMLFLDACRDNPFAEQLARSATSNQRSAAFNRGLAVMRPVGDMLISFATLPNTVASDGDGENSPFAKALANHMRTADTEISVLLKRVTHDVIADTGGTQRPQQLSQMQREFYFARTASEDVKREQARSILSVYPAEAKTGEEVALLADVPQGCLPTFFDLSKSGTATPVPLRFFRQTLFDNGQTRFEISPGSRYGLVVQEKDERGAHLLGFFCEPKGLDQDGKKALLQELIRRFANDELEGTLDTPVSKDTLFHFAKYAVQ